MVVPFKAVRTQAVFAMVILLTIFTKMAVLAFIVIGTLHTSRTEMFLIFCRHDAIAMRATFFLAVIHATVLTNATIGTTLYAKSLGAITTLLAKPFILFTAVHAMFASAKALLIFVVIAKTETTIGAMLLLVRTKHTQATFLTNLLITHVTLTTMVSILVYTVDANAMLQTAAFC